MKERRELKDPYMEAFAQLLELQRDYKELKESRPDLLSLTVASDIEISITSGVIWIDTDQGCIIRISKVNGNIFVDDRRVNVAQGDRQKVSDIPKLLPSDETISSCK